MSKESEVKLDELNCLYSLLDRANHDEYLSRIGKKEALEFLNQNKKYAIILRQSLQRLEAIDNAEPIKALRELDTIRHLEIGFDKNGKPITLNDIDSLNIIKQYILKTQEHEKDRVFLKNIGNTKVKVPLVHIFSGLSQEKKFAYTEHIYYHWEEMKESLEAEIKTIKTEKETLESKSRRQEKVLKIIKEKGVDVGYLRTCKTLEEYNENCWNDDEDYNKKLTQYEFDTLKRYFE